MTDDAKSKRAGSTELERRLGIIRREIHKRGGDESLAYVVMEAAHDRLGLPLALGLVQVESGFRNIYGHDSVQNPIKSPAGGHLGVTHENYHRYKQHRDAGEGNQGVGPGQLTAKVFQDRADALGGCWVPKYNLLVAYADLDAMVQAYGRTDGIAAYNTGPGGRHGAQGQHYSNIVRTAAAEWYQLIK